MKQEIDYGKIAFNALWEKMSSWDTLWAEAKEDWNKCAQAVISAYQAANPPAEAVRVSPDDLERIFSHITPRPSWGESTRKHIASEINALLTPTAQAGDNCACKNLGGTGHLMECPMCEKCHRESDVDEVTELRTKLYARDALIGRLRSGYEAMTVQIGGTLKQRDDLRDELDKTKAALEEKTTSNTMACERIKELQDQRDVRKDWMSTVAGAIHGTSFATTALEPVLAVIRSLRQQSGERDNLKKELEETKVALYHRGGEVILAKQERDELKAALAKLQWVPCSERMPTIEDAADTHMVLWRYQDDDRILSNWDNADKSVTHWMAISALPPTPVKEPQIHLYEEIADLLGSIGWASPNDAQWTGLRDSLPKLKEMLAGQASTKGAS